MLIVLRMRLSSLFILIFCNVISSLVASPSLLSSTIELPYYNLSCPFEWARYSCIYKNSSNSQESNNYYKSKHQYDINKSLVNLTNRTVLLVGDSLTRQLFVSISCLTIKNVIFNYVDWMYWPCYQDLSHCISSGLHSGFNIGYIEWFNGAKLNFQSLGGGYRYIESNIIKRFANELNKFKYIHSYEPSYKFPNNNISSTILSNNDIVIINLGFHQDDINSFKIKLFEFIEVGKQILKYHNESTPYLVYITSSTQHFNKNGTYIGPDNNDDNNNCIKESLHNPRKELEEKYLIEGESIHKLINFDDLKLGNLHIGGNDCTHYCMPGLPDIKAELIFNELNHLLISNK